LRAWGRPRIEGARLSDAEVEKLLSGLRSESFASRDEQEVAGYADAMDMIFDGYESITTTENHIKQLHGVLLKYSAKDQDHRGEYKKVPNDVQGHWTRRQKPGRGVRDRDAV
jgi:Fic family protein